MSESDGDVGVEEMKVRRVAGTGVPVRGDDIDTDQIIPARFLKTTTWEGMDQYAFYDARRDDDGELNDHPFNVYTGNVLVVNDNFGCGSSREHAPQALMRWGIEAIVGESFAEIFADNCGSLGIPTVTLGADEVDEIQARIEDEPEAPLEVDVEKERVVVGGTEYDADVTDAQKEALVEGIWDTTALMRSSLDRAKETYDELPYTGW